MTPSGLIAAWPRSLPALFACVCLSFATPLPRAFGQEVGNPFLDTGTAGKLGGGRSPGPQGPGDTVGPGAGGTGGTGGSGGTAPAPGTGSGSSDGAGPAGGPQGLPVGGAGPGPVQGAPATGGGTPPPTTGPGQVCKWCATP